MGHAPVWPDADGDSAGRWSVGAGRMAMDEPRHPLEAAPVQSRRPGRRDAAQDRRQQDYDGEKAGTSKPESKSGIIGERSPAEQIAPNTRK